MSYTIDKRIEQIDILYNKIELLYHQIAIKQGLSDSAFMILRAILIPVSYTHLTLPTMAVV